MFKFFTALLISLALISPGASQETSYQPQDAHLLQNCLETVRTINEDPENQQTVSFRECIGVAARACQDETEMSQTTVGMAQCNQRETMWWDEQLNDLYATISGSIGAQEFDELQKAQRAWIAFRDAECAFQYFYWREGTISRLFGSFCTLETTAERTLDLREVMSWTQM